MLTWTLLLCQIKIKETGFSCHILHFSQPEVGEVHKISQSKCTNTYVQTYISTPLEPEVSNSSSKLSSIQPKTF